MIPVTRQEIEEQLDRLEKAGEGVFPALSYYDGARTALMYVLGLSTEQVIEDDHEYPDGSN